MRRAGVAIACVIIMLVAVCGVASIQNGAFSSGILGWKSSWHVTSTDGDAVLTDSQANHAFMFQAVPQTGTFTFEFDFINALSTDVPRGTFRDSFYASLYFVDKPSQFVLEHDQFGGSSGVMDLDAGGVFNVKGTISASQKGGQWQHFKGTFTNDHPYAVVVFELYDLNQVGGDSSVRVDGVSVE